MLLFRMNAIDFLSGDDTPPPAARVPEGPPRPRPPPSGAGPFVQTYSPTVQLQPASPALNLIARPSSSIVNVEKGSVSAV